MSACNACHVPAVPKAYTSSQAMSISLVWMMLHRPPSHVRPPRSYPRPPQPRPHPSPPLPWTSLLQSLPRNRTSVNNHLHMLLLPSSHRSKSRRPRLLLLCFLLNFKPCHDNPIRSTNMPPILLLLLPPDLLHTRLATLRSCPRTSRMRPKCHSNHLKPRGIPLCSSGGSVGRCQVAFAKTLS